jgi:Transposase DDE domain
MANGELSCMVKTPRLWADCVPYERAPPRFNRPHRRLHRRASKKQMSTRPGTFEFAKYVLLFTTRFSGSTTEVLDLYRTRWQIELLFKRLKSLALIGHLPKHDARSSRAWLYGKLLVALLTEKLIRVGRDISPQS